MSADDYRVERDSMGELRVPAEALWGAQTQRAVENFPISGLRHAARVHPRARPGQVGRGRAPTSSSACSTACAASPSEGRPRGGRGPARRPVPGRRVPDRLRHQQQHERQRGDRAPRHAVCRRPRGASQRPRQPEPEQQRRDPDRDPRRARRWRSPSSCCRRSRSCAETIGRKAGDVGDVVKTGRTHLMDAMPLTLRPGARRAGARRSTTASRASQACRPRLHALALGGTAVGTGVNAHRRVRARGDRAAVASRPASTCSPAATCSRRSPRRTPPSSCPASCARSPWR